VVVDVDRQAVSIIEDATPHNVGTRLSHIRRFASPRRSDLSLNVAITIP
jgi:hypothetical protein